MANDDPAQVRGEARAEVCFVLVHLYHGFVWTFRMWLYACHCQYRGEHSVKNVKNPVVD